MTLTSLMLYGRVMLMKQDPNTYNRLVIRNNNVFCRSICPICRTSIPDPQYLIVSLEGTGTILCNECIRDNDLAIWSLWKNYEDIKQYGPVVGAKPYLIKNITWQTGCDDTLPTELVYATDNVDFQYDNCEYVIQSAIQEKYGDVPLDFDVEEFDTTPEFINYMKEGEIIGNWLKVKSVE